MLHSTCQQLKSQQWPQEWKRSVFISIPKKGNAKECSNYCTTTFISHVGKVTLIILQARLLQYGNQEHPDDTSWVSKRNKRSNCQHSLDGGESKAIPEKKKIYVCFTDSWKAFDCLDPNKTVENSWDENTRPPYLSPEKSVYMTRSNSLNWTWNNRLVQNWERSTTQLYIVTLLI